MLVFQHGVQLREYRGPRMSQTVRDDLLDKYNGYSGNVASALGRPLELVISMMSHLLVLRILAGALLQPEPKWHVALVAFVLSVVLDFFLNNGFNALNVQLRDVDVEPRMRVSDMSALVGEERLNVTNTTSVTTTYAETQPTNLIANTVLRNIVLPAVPKALPKCLYNFDRKTEEDNVVFGFTQREWMKHVLPDARTAKMLRFVVNATAKNANINVSSSSLPMEASTAADLLLTAAMVSGSYIPWGDRHYQGSGGTSDYWKTTLKPAVFGNRKEGDTLPTAVAAGLLPPNETASEQDRRDWLLRSSAAFLKSIPMFPNNMSRSNIEIEFAHVNISASFVFKSVSLQVEVDPKFLKTGAATKNGTRVLDGACGPWPRICSLPRRDEDTPMVVHAYAACANDDGTETLQSLPESRYMNDFNIQCPRASNTSLILISTAERLVADAVVYAHHQQPGAVNARKLYTLTVGRLEWKTEDLAARYNASCDAPGGCVGMTWDLTNGKQLLVAAKGYPHDTLSLVRYNYIFNETALRPL